MQRKLLIAIFIVLTPFLYNDPAIAKTSVLFSPEDKPTTHLISQINKAKEKIYAAVYMLTDKSIALSLIEAKKRNVDVQVITDYSSVSSQYGKIALLKQNGIKTFVYYLPSLNSRRRAPLMHNKFAIIDNIIWTGSFNWTVSANRCNEENVIYTDSKKVYKKYLDRFEVIKKKCAIKHVAHAKNKNFIKKTGTGKKDT